MRGWGRAAWIIYLGVAIIVQLLPSTLLALETDDFDAAVQLFQNGEYKQAIRAFQKVVRQHPQSIRAHYNLGLCLLHENQYRESRRSFEQVLQLAPTASLVHFYMGRTYYGEAHFKEAELEFRKALENYSELAILHHYEALSLYHMGQFDAAINHFLRAVSLRPRFAPAYYGLGFCYRAKGELSESRRALEKVVVLDSSGKLGLAAERLLKVSGEKAPMEVPVE